MIKPPLKWHGGKRYLASRIISLMPSHIHYVEPFAGGLSVLLAKDPEGVSEVVNDVAKDLTVFWQTLQDEEQFSLFRRMVEATPFSEQSWEHARSALDACRLQAKPYCRAAWFFVHCRQSLAGRMKSFTGITRTRTRRGMNNEVSAWLSAIDGLAEVHARLKRVLILNGRNALNIIPHQDGKQTLFYCDPPYLQSTRTAPDIYMHEMLPGEHEQFLRLLLVCKGKVMLSGYRNELYDDLLQKWRRVDWEIPNHSAGGKEKRIMTESLWMNWEESA